MIQAGLAAMGVVTNAIAKFEATMPKTIGYCISEVSA